MEAIQKITNSIDRGHAGKVVLNLKKASNTITVAYCEIKLKGTVSVDIACGIPQGSVLSHKFFFRYINGEHY